MFVYQSPVRTIVLGDDEYDTSLDKEHKCKIKATLPALTMEERLCERSC